MNKTKSTGRKRVSKKPSKSLNLTKKIKIPLAQVASFLVGGIAVITVIAAMIHALLKDDDAIRQISGEAVKPLVTTAAWLIIMLALALFCIGTVVYFIRFFFRIVRKICKGEEKVKVIDADFLRLVSVLSLVFFLLLVPETDLVNWIDFKKNSEQLGAPLLLLVILSASFLYVNIAYRMLKGFMEPDSILRKYLHQILYMLLTMAGDLIKGILEFLKLIPELPMNFAYLLKGEGIEEDTEGEDETENSDRQEVEEIKEMV